MVDRVEISSFITFDRHEDFKDVGICGADSLNTLALEGKKTVGIKKHTKKTLFFYISIIFAII